MRVKNKQQEGWEALIETRGKLNEESVNYMEIVDLEVSPEIWQDEAWDNAWEILPHFV